MTTNGNDTVTNHHYQAEGSQDLTGFQESNAHADVYEKNGYHPPSFSEIILNAIDETTNSSEHVDFIRSKLHEYEQFNARKFEEKDQVIEQLRQNLVNLTDKRMRALNNSGNSDPNTLNSSMQFFINERDTQIADLTNKIEEKQKEIENLKAVVKDQDAIILSHNNNIYEIKMSNETVLRAKQESFRHMNEDLKQKAQLIEDQTLVIKNLKEKIETLEENFSESRNTLETRLNEKNVDLQTKIASFEANLYQGRQYFEEMLNEKDAIIKEKTGELNRLKLKLGGTLISENNVGSEESTDEASLDESPTDKAGNMISKFDEENMKNMKALYEHQIDLLKVKIQMLEKTCLNYKQGIKDMNKSFGYQQQADEMSSIQVFKNMMQELQKANAQLETERIDLQVGSARLADDLERLRVEKDNLNRKFVSADLVSQRLQSERNEFESSYRNQLSSKQAEVNELTGGMDALRADYESLRTYNESLIVVQGEHEQLKVTHAELTQHYEQLYQQASDIVNGNQILNEQVSANAMQIAQLEEIVEEYQLKLDHLGHCNSELNTQKINLDMKLAEMEAKLENYELDLKDLQLLKNNKIEIEKLQKRFKELEIDLQEKNDLIEQLNQAKEYLVENNSKLLTHNIKIQLFVESMGLDLENMESNASVREYEFLRNQFKESQVEINELKAKNEKIVHSSSVLAEKIGAKERELSDLQCKFHELNSEMSLLRARVLTDVATQCDGDDEDLLPSQVKTEVLEPKVEQKDTEFEPETANSVSKESQEDFIRQIQFNFNELQNENDELLNEIGELKEKLSSLEAIKNTNESLTQELEENRQKLSNVEQNNAKLKAKLKQYIKQKKQETSSPEETTTTTITPKRQEPSNEQELLNLQSKLKQSQAEIVELTSRIKSLESTPAVVTSPPVSIDQTDLGKQAFHSGSEHASATIYSQVAAKIDAVQSENLTLILDQALQISDLMELNRSLITQKDQEIKRLHKTLKKDGKQRELERQLNERISEVDLLNGELDQLKKVLKGYENNADLQSELDTLSVLYNEKVNELALLHEQVADLKSLAPAAIAIDTISEELTKSQTELAKVVAQNTELDSTINALRSDLGALQKKHDTLKVKTQTLKNKSKKKEATSGVQEENHEELEKLKSDMIESERQLKEQLESKRSVVEKLQLELSRVNQQQEISVQSLNQTFSDKLAACEKNLTQVQEENDLLGKQIEELKEQRSVELTVLETSFEQVKRDKKELESKLAGVEQQNAKYKVKLKQFIKKQQLQQQLKQSHAHSETSSGRMTPLAISIPDGSNQSISSSNSPLAFSPNPVQHCTTSTSIQTTLTSDQINTLQSDQTTFESQLDSYRAEASKLNEQLAQMQVQYESRIESLATHNTELDNKLTDLIDKLEKTKLEMVNPVQAVSNNSATEAVDVEALKSKLETAQQQNTKLKIKLKQLLEKNKAKQSKLEDSPTKSSESIGINENAEIQAENASLKKQVTEQTNELDRLTRMIRDLEMNTHNSSRRNSPTNDLSLVEQKQKTIDGLTGVLNLTSAQLETEKYNSQVALTNMQNQLYERDMRISELRNYIDVVNGQRNMQLDNVTPLNSLPSDVNHLQNTEAQGMLVNSEKELVELKSQLEESQREVETLRSEHASAIESLMNQIAGKGGEVLQLNEQINGLKQSLEEELQLKEDEINKVNKELGKETSRIMSLNTDLHNVLKSNQNEIDRLKSEISQKTTENDILLAETKKSIDRSQLTTLEEEKNNQIDKLKNQVLELSASESDLKTTLAAERTELSILKDQLEALRNDSDTGLRQFEKKFQEEIMNKEEQIVRLTEDLEQAYAKLDQTKLEHEASLNSLEQKYFEQLADINQQNELNSSHSDMEFENQIRLKQAHVDRMQGELDALQERLTRMADDGEGRMAEVSRQMAAKDDEILELRQRYEQDMAEYYRQNEINLQSMTEKFTTEFDQKEKALLLSDSQKTELENLVVLKQKMTEDLTNQLSELKKFIDTQRVQYEQQMTTLMASIKEKDSRLADMLSELNDYKLLQTQTMVRSSASNNSLKTLDPIGKGNALEEQLKFCHEKCELVVGTLSQLKQQNENLNNRIKSYRSKISIV